MSEELEEIVEESTVDQPTEEVVEKQEPADDKPKNEVTEDGTIKLDLSNLNKIPNPIDTTEEVVEEPVEEIKQEEEKVVEEVNEEQQEQPVLEEISEEEVQEQTEQLTEEVEEAVAEAKETGIELPENIQKAVDFMNDTGGSLEDYVRLNQDFSSFNDNQLLREYYSQTKPHLSNDEIDFLIEDSFSYDEEEDTEREIKRKKLALKEQVASAKSHLDGQKSKYYEEIKAGSRLAPEQQKAIDFFNRYNKESEQNNKVLQTQKSIFNKKTEQVFSNEFKGFEYKVGDKKYRFNVKDVDSVKNSQSDINNFVKKFLNENNELSDAKGYHKSLFTAMNADQVAQHFYEQGKADALKASVANSKNVDMGPRGVHEETTTSNGWTVRAIQDGESSSKLKVRFRK